MIRGNLHRLLGSLACCFVLAGSVVQAESPAVKSSQTTQVKGPISAELVKPHIEFLADEKLRGRSGAGALIAAQYIKRHFQHWGLQPLFAEEEFFQEIPGSAGDDGKPRVAGRNVGAWIPGSDPKVRDELIIISAHYDHLGVRGGKIFRGADDNASGVSMLLEVARSIAQSKQKPRRSVVFIGFDLEERMLWGSRWFVSHAPWPLKQVKLFITADMIGRSLGNLDLPAVFVVGSEHAPQLRQVLGEVRHPKGLQVARLGVDLIGTRSDYGPFRDRRVPFLFFSTGEHPDYHTPADVPERIDYRKVAGVSNLVLQICNKVANAETTPVWTDKIEPDLDEARTLNKIATLLLERAEERKLTDLQRFVVVQAKMKTQQILDRGKITNSERTWLARLAQFMLLSIF